MAGEKYGILDTIGIVSSRRLAETVMNNVQMKYASDIQKYVKGRHILELYFTDGTRLVLCPASAASRGRRVTYALIDEGIRDVELLNNVIYPMCAYCDDGKIFTISDSQEATKIAFNIIDSIRESKYVK